MAYIKTNWEDGDVISEARLDHLENGVYNNSVAIGDLTDLDTTDKTNLVAAINEAAQSGGGSGGMSNAVKDALLQIASKVAYIDADGQDYYDDLYDALYPAASIVSIQADYTQTGTVYPTTSLEDLRNDLAVSAIYDNGSVVPVISYTLSGTLSVGTSTITVTYSGFTDTFEVTVSAVPTVSSISAVYTQSGTVYDTDSLDSLKSDLVVTATYSDSSTATVPSEDYTLSGSMAHGTNTITVTYEGLTTTFTVTVSEHWTYSIDDLTRAGGAMVNTASADCGTALAETTNNRYSFFRNSGSTSVAIQRNNTIKSQTSDYYPVKVPQGATALTVTITPSTQYVAAYPRKLNDGKYETWTMATGSSSYIEHETSFTFDAADDNCYIFMTTKYNNAGTSYPTAPTGLDIVFS